MPILLSVSFCVCFFYALFASVRVDRVILLLLLLLFLLILFIQNLNKGEDLVPEHRFKPPVVLIVICYKRKGYNIDA